MDGVGWRLGVEHFKRKPISENTTSPVEHHHPHNKNHTIIVLFIVFSVLR